MGWDGDGEGDEDGSEQCRRRRRERDEPGGAARGAVGPGRSSRRRRGVVALREDCVEDLGVLAVVRRAYVVPLDRPFVRKARESKVYEKRPLMSSFPLQISPLLVCWLTKSYSHRETMVLGLSALSTDFCVRNPIWQPGLACRRRIEARRSIYFYIQLQLSS